MPAIQVIQDLPVLPYRGAHNDYWAHIMTCPVCEPAVQAAIAASEDPDVPDDATIEMPLCDDGADLDVAVWAAINDQHQRSALN
jgi:hypothetical protein